MKNFKLIVLMSAVMTAGVFTACVTKDNTPPPPEAPAKKEAPPKTVQETPKSAETPKPAEAPAGGAAAGGDLAAKGKTLFQSNGCEVCHKPDGTGGVANAPNFTDAAWQTKEKDDAKLMKSIKTGVAGTAMAAYGKFTDDELKALVAHVRSFKK
jgi:mono/diheme cytochrome c family protein